jgi:predicted O-linked N-acetylglucosamine transferase (SPINDLY family)
MEAPDAQNHYCERLVRLPNLSIYYVPIESPPEPERRSALGLRDSATVYWSGQTTSKFLPQYDDVFVKIASAVGDCQFVFLENSEDGAVTQRFRQRLNRAFGAAGLKADDHCVILPRLTMSKYVAAMGAGDIFLDSIGWSGCNTTLESLTYDMPVVTMPGDTMRSRHSAAILSLMRVDETIAQDVNAYIAIGTRLARDIPFRNAVKSKINASKHRVYRDKEAIEGLERFLERAARPMT